MQEKNTWFDKADEYDRWEEIEEEKKRISV